MHLNITDPWTQTLSLRWVRTGTVTWRSRPGEGPPSAPPVVTTPLMSNSGLFLKSYIENNMWLLSGCCYICHRLCQLNIWTFAHQLMYWAASCGSCLEPSSTTRHCFICLKLASISFFISVNVWIPLNELMTCCKNKATSKSKSWGGFCKIEEAWKIDSSDLFSLHI